MLGRASENGLRLLDTLESEGQLDDYYLLPATHADLLRRLGRWPEAAEAYRRALVIVGNTTQRRFLRRRLTEVETEARGHAS